MDKLCVHGVSEAENGERLDVIAAAAAGVTRSATYELLPNGSFVRREP